MKRTLTAWLLLAVCGGCTDEEAPTVLVAHLRDPFALAVEGDHLYWTSYDAHAGARAWQIWRCNATDCAYSRQPIFQASAKVGLLIHKETLYFAYQGSIASCPVSGCATPTIIVASAPGAMPSAVDDANIYWWTTPDSDFSSCPLSGCDAATTSSSTGLRTVLGSGADGASLYWLGPAGSSGNVIHGAPKDGSTPPKMLVSAVFRPGSFLVADGFVYWASAGAAQWVQRCPVSGCPDEGPEVLAEGQDHPERFAFDNGSLFWITTPEANAGSPRLQKIMGCAVADCPHSVEELASFQSESDPRNPVASVASIPLVVDSHAIYWFGDITLVSPSGSRPFVTDAALCRLARKPGR